MLLRQNVHEDHPHIKQTRMFFPIPADAGRCYVARVGMSLEVPVLVVGGGPVGLLMAVGLRHGGVDCLVVEKHASTLDFPKGRRVTTRTVGDPPAVGPGTGRQGRSRCPRRIACSAFRATRCSAMTTSAGPCRSTRSSPRALPVS